MLEVSSFLLVEAILEAWSIYLWNPVDDANLYRLPSEGISVIGFIGLVS